MARKYSKKASEKVARTMREFKRGKLKSGSGGKVTSREQAIAIGISQARRAGYKAPKAAHASMGLDARVRAYLGSMRPGTEIDARGMARALGGVDPLEADYALERAEKAGQAVTSDGRWFGPRGGSSHARKKTGAQLDREIAAVIGRSSHATKYDKDDALMYGHYAYRMEQTKAQALANARAAGFAAFQLDAVEKGWEDERRDTIHGGFAHAKKRAHATAKRPTPYRIKLTPSELRAVEFARGRYAWPDMLAAHAAEDGSVAFTESEMWSWTDDVDSDAEGGHSPFPLASDAFADKLQRFYDERV